MTEGGDYVILFDVDLEKEGLDITKPGTGANGSKIDSKQSIKVTVPTDQALLNAGKTQYSNLTLNAGYRKAEKTPTVTPTVTPVTPTVKPTVTPTVAPQKSNGGSSGTGYTTWGSSTTRTTAAGDKIPETTTTKSPQTGDDAPIMMWITILLASMALIAGAAVLYRRKTRRKN